MSEEATASSEKVASDGTKEPSNAGDSSTNTAAAAAAAKSPNRRGGGGGGRGRGGRGRGSGRGRGGRGQGRNDGKKTTQPSTDDQKEAKGENVPELTEENEEVNKNWAPAMLGQTTANGGTATTAPTAEEEENNNKEESNKTESNKSDTKSNPKNRLRNGRKNNKGNSNKKLTESTGAARAVEAKAEEVKESKKEPETNNRKNDNNNNRKKPQTVASSGAEGTEAAPEEAKTAAQQPANNKKYNNKNRKKPQKVASSGEAEANVPSAEANVEEAPEELKEAPPKTNKNKSNKNRKKPQKAGDESRAEKETTEEQKPVRQATAKKENNKTNNATPQDEIEMLKKELVATKEKLKESERISENRKNRYSQLNEKWRLMKSTETGVAKEEGTEPTVAKTGDESVLQEELDKKTAELQESEKKSEARKAQLVQLNRVWSQGKKEIEKLKQEVAKLKKDEKITKEKLKVSERVAKATKRRFTLLNEKWAKLKMSEGGSATGTAQQEGEETQLPEKVEEAEELEVAKEAEFDGKICLSSHELETTHTNDPVSLDTSNPLPLSYDERQANLETAQGEPKETKEATVGEENELYLKELDFIEKAHGKEDVTIDGRKVTRHLQLPIERNKETVLVDLILNIPVQYPTKGIIMISAILVPNSDASKEANDCAMEHVSELTKVCGSEAEACEGHEAIFNVFASADTWIKDEWTAIQANKFPYKIAL